MGKARPNGAKAAQSLKGLRPLRPEIFTFGSAIFTKKIIPEVDELPLTNLFFSFRF